MGFALLNRLEDFQHCMHVKSQAAQACELRRVIVYTVEYITVVYF